MKKLYKNEYDKKVCGVCSGIAEYFDLDPNLVRIGVFIGTVLTGFFPGAIVYVACAVILPSKGEA